MILKIFFYHSQCYNSIFQNSQINPMFTIKTMLNQCSFFLCKSSSFNLAKLIGFKSRLCPDKRVLKHLPVSPTYTFEQSLHGIL